MNVKRKNALYIFATITGICFIFFLLVVITPQNKKKENYNKKSIYSVLESPDAINGKKLFRDIISSYPKIDPFYKSPTLSGGVLQIPMINLFLPQGVWAQLDDEQKKLLKAYASSETI